MSKTKTIAQFIHAIRQLPSDEPVVNVEVWYKTQKEHWLEWLKGYQGSGGYGRKVDKERDARFAYNHVVNPEMLLWIIPAAGVKPGLVKAARRAFCSWRHSPAEICCHTKIGALGGIGECSLELRRIVAGAFSCEKKFLPGWS